MISVCRSWPRSRPQWGPFRYSPEATGARTRREGGHPGGRIERRQEMNPFTDKEDGIAAGKKLYIQVGCQGCHGGGGGGGMATSLIDDNWKFGSDDETLFKLIKGQIPEQTMPTVYNTLPDEQVWQILAFIRTLYIGDPAKKNW